MIELLPICECGCDKPVTKIGNRFIQGHNNRCKTEESCKKSSESAIKRFSDPKERKRASEIGYKKFEDPEYRKMMLESHLKEQDPLPEDWEIDRNSKTVTNKNSSQYLGVFIAEKILSNIFKHVQRMPQCNHGFDVICDNNYKIDIKSSATWNVDGYWQFAIKQNKIADYFLLLGFEDRNDFTPVRLWLIPGNVINHLKGLKIRKTAIKRWSKYEQPIDKVILCCDEMKGEN